MFENQDICWVCLASMLMVGGYSLIWSSEPGLRSFKLQYEITAEQPSHSPEPDSTRLQTVSSDQTLELAQTPGQNNPQD